VDGVQALGTPLSTVPGSTIRSISPSCRIHVDSITLTIKSLKPAHTFTVSAHPTDSISSLKQKIATLPRAPPADWQRLLLKGKALTDSKLLKEYNVEDGAILNLTIKPGSVWTGDLKEQGHTNTTAPEGDASHRPVPSLVLSEDPTPTGSGVPSPSSYPMRPSTPSASNAYKTVMTSPAFWERLHQFLLKEFKEHGEAETAFEVFLAASKEVMTAQDIAKIRDVVGVVGMAGT
jgi:hypothetical protein